MGRLDTLPETPIESDGLTDGLRKLRRECARDDITSKNSDIVSGQHKVGLIVYFLGGRGSTGETISYHRRH